MKKQLLQTVPLLLIGLSTSIGVNAQQNTVTTGGVASGSGGTVTYSIGQVAYQSSNGSNGNVNEGVQQPFEIYSLGINESIFQFNLTAFPNPTTNFINLNVSNFSGENLSFQLVDLNGKIIQKKQITTNETEISMSELPSANYFIYLFLNEQKVQSFKIIKN